MVDRMETNEAAQIEVGAAPAERKAWVTPRLETADLVENTTNFTGTAADTGSTS